MTCLDDVFLAVFFEGNRRVFAVLAAIIATGKGMALKGRMASKTSKQEAGCQQRHSFRKPFMLQLQHTIISMKIGRLGFCKPMAGMKSNHMIMTILTTGQSSGGKVTIVF